MRRVRCEGQPFESMLEEQSEFTWSRNIINISLQVHSDTVRPRACAPPPGRGVARAGSGGVRSGRASGPGRAGSAGGRSVGRPLVARAPRTGRARGRSGPGALSRTVQVR